LYALAVRPGDVVADVPEPQTLALLALGAMAVTRRRLKAEGYALFWLPWMEVSSPTPPV
jgi:hypothetical protein